MTDVKQLTERMLKFRDERDWKQFHNPKDLAISLSLEASEVLEHFQWKTNEEVAKYVKTDREEIGDELGDVMNNLLLLAEAVGVDILDAAEKKIEKNEKKYPVDKVKGSAKKYDQY